MWLGALAGANVIISLYYYLGVIRRVYVLPPADPTPIEVARPLRWALVATLIGTVLLGVVQGPFLTWASRAAEAIH